MPCSSVHLALRLGAARGGAYDYQGTFPYVGVAPVLSSRAIGRICSRD